MKKMLIFLVVMFLMVVPVGASAIYITIDSVTPGIGNVGQDNLTIGGISGYKAYCIEHGANSYIGQPYDGTIETLQDGQLWQASLFYDLYKEGHTVGNQEAYNLQVAIWGTPVSFTNDANLLRSLFSWVFVPNVNCNWGQDFIIYNPHTVAEPSTLLLFGFGLIGLAGVSRKNG